MKTPSPKQQHYLRIVGDYGFVLRNYRMTQIHWQHMKSCISQSLRIFRDIYFQNLYAPNTKYQSWHSCHKKVKQWKWMAAVVRRLARFFLWSGSPRLQRTRASTSPTRGVARSWLGYLTTMLVVAAFSGLNIWISHNLYCNNNTLYISYTGLPQNVSL